MLILSRREAETVCLGDNIVLTIVAVGHDKVRVGVKAPEGVRILRTELEPTTLPFNPPPAIAALDAHADANADTGTKIIPATQIPHDPTAPLKAIMLRTQNARKANESSKRAA